MFQPLLPVAAWSEPEPAANVAVVPPVGDAVPAPVDGLGVSSLKFHCAMISWAGSGIVQAYRLTRVMRMVFFMGVWVWVYV